MILTITPNPTIDRVLFVRNFAMQDLVRAEREVSSPSGKGLDVSLLLHDWGAVTHAIALKAGRHGDLLAAMVAARGVTTDWIEAHGETRMAALITDVVQGRQSTVLAHTLQADAGTLPALQDRLAQTAGQAWGLVCAGSLPPGLAADTYARLLDQAHEQGLCTLLDSSGPGLQHGVSACPHILKLNRAELGALAPDLDGAFVGTSPRDLLPGAQRLMTYLGRWARSAIIVTLGRRGMLGVARDEGDEAARSYYVPALPMPVVSAAGAGDAVSAGLLWARRRGLDWRSAMAYGAAAAAVSVTQASTSTCPRAAVKRILASVHVETIL